MLLAALGKSGKRVAAVFAADTGRLPLPLVNHLRRGAPGIPIWLFSTFEPPADVASLCDSVTVRRKAAKLVVQAAKDLWRQWVVIGAASWDGQPGNRLLKLAPFLIPPFRAVLANGNGDFLSGTVPNILFHCRRRLRDAVHSARNRLLDLAKAYWGIVTCHIWRSGPWNRVKDVSRAYWLLVTYHIWRSGPCTRVKHVAAARMLWASAMVLKRCGYPDRHLFQRLHGGMPLFISCPASAPGGIAHYRHVGTAWNGAAFEKFLMSSEARWVVWRPRTPAISPKARLCCSKTRAPLPSRAGSLPRLEDRVASDRAFSRSRSRRSHRSGGSALAHHRVRPGEGAGVGRPPVRPGLDRLDASFLESGRRRLALL